MGAAPPALDLEQLFELADSEREQTCGSDAVEPPPCEPLAVKLACGGVHLCYGKYCTDVELNQDSQYACKFTGVVTGALALREGLSTGRQAGTVDPDAHAGEPMGGTWKAKKNFGAMSASAVVAASGVDEQAPTPFMEKFVDNSAKRAARCVDDTSAPYQHRSKVARSVAKTDLHGLAEEARQYISTLVNHERRPEKQEAAADAPSLLLASAKRYLKECAVDGVRPTVEALHCLAIAAERDAAKRASAAPAAGKAPGAAPKRSLLRRVSVSHSVPALIASLWVASCQTPYFATARRGADSFRPFVSGALYALKRGVALRDGTVILPKLPELTAELPTLRTATANSAAKALHASSHRGLCSLHRAIASCDDAKASRLFFTSASLSKQLVRDVAGCGRA